jgi:DNA-binding transcriptional LysR family regulator
MRIGYHYGAGVDVHLRDLRYFVQVAEERHFTNAAKRMHVSQPAVSRQIAKLEADLRVQLLARDRRGVTLTAAGEQLLTHARALLADWDTAERALRDAAAGENAVLRVGQQTSIGRGILAHLVAELAERRPGWRVELRQSSWSDPSAGLDDSSADVAVCWLPLPHQDRYRTHVLVAEDVVLALAATHALAGTGTLRFAQIEDVALLALPEDAGPLRDFWLARHARAGRPAPIAGTVGSADEALDAVEAGIGGVLMSMGNAHLYRRPGVACVPVTDLPQALLALVSRRDDGRGIIRDAFEIAGTTPPVPPGATTPPVPPGATTPPAPPAR